MRVLIFGDSIAEGYYDNHNGGWANRLRTFYWKEDKSIEVGLCGVSGDEIPNIIKRFDITTKGFIEKFQDEVIFIFAVGINDSAILKGEEGLYSEDSFKINLETLIEMANKHKPKNIIFTGLTHVNEELTNPLKVSKTGKCYQNTRIGNFDTVIKEVSLKNSCKFIDTFALLNDKDLYDGIHPNEGGHKKMFKYINTKLELY